MNLTEWRTAVKAQAGRLRSRLSDLVLHTEQLAPGVIYGATAGLAVAPLVAAAQSGAVPYGELAALLGGAGVNILSNELYIWKQRSEEQLSEELPARLGKLAAENTAWRDLLNTLIQETEAAAAARDTLGVAANAYLAALEQDLQRLGNRLIIANVNGAQNVIIGDNNVQNIITNNYYGSPPPLTFTDVLRTYLVEERRICDDLPLARPKPDAQRAPRMQRVFVELRTETPVDEATWFDRLHVAENRRNAIRNDLRHMTTDKAARQQPNAAPLWFLELHRLDDEKLAAAVKSLNVTPAQVQAARHPLTPLECLRRQNHAPHLLLLGDPGGGKSTWVRRLTSVLAWQWLTTAGEPAEHLAVLGEEENAWLRAANAAFGRSASLAPIRIAMHRWASLVRRGELTLTGQAGDLVSICARTLQSACAVEGISIADHTQQLLQQGGAVLLLDGLDEVTDETQRRMMLAAVRAFAAPGSYRRTPLLITCRRRPYARWQQQGQAVLNTAHVHTLGPLDEDAIHHFIDRWYAEMTWAERGKPQKLLEDARRLHEALPVREDLRRMADTPLLLTMMARTNQESGLPDGRAELYENLVKELLWEWEDRRTYGEGGDLAAASADVRSLQDILQAARPDLSRAHLEQVLNQLAYAVHGAGGEDAVEIERERLEQWLSQLLPHDRNDGKTRGEALTLATNVVNFIGERTGLLVDIEDGLRFRFTHRTFQEYLAARWIATGSYSARLQKVQERVDDVNWREAIFLALGCMVSSVNKAYDDALMVVERLLHQSPITPQDWARLLLVGEAFVRQFAPEKLDLATDVVARSTTLDRVHERLRQAMQERTLAPAQRLEAGLLLDDLRTQHGMAPEGLDDFIPVPGAGFAVGKYPVTNAQFRRFVEAGGYGEKEVRRPVWWSKAGWKKRQQEDWTEPRYWDDRWVNRDTQPVVGVSWYEAEAYCAWLNLTPEGRQHKPKGMKAQLPTREQWMLAARNGRASLAKEDKDYPWRGPFDKALANTAESNFRQTTPVEMYPDGATPAGVCDLAGNVWEWTADENPKYRDVDVVVWLKGGSWYNDARKAQTSAAVNRNVGGGRLGDFGFRVVCVPDLSLLVLAAGC